MISKLKLGLQGLRAQHAATQVEWLNSQDSALIHTVTKRQTSKFASDIGVCKHSRPTDTTVTSLT